MKRVFADTNILIDLIADRQPYSKFAVRLFQKAENKEIEIFTSTHSIATAHYVLKKYTSEEHLRDILYQLMNYITVIPIDTDMIKKGLRSGYRDFEDSLQIFCATSITQIDCIITRNIKDFRDSEIPAFTPDQVLQE